MLNIVLLILAAATQPASQPATRPASRPASRPTSRPAESRNWVYISKYARSYHTADCPLTRGAEMERAWLGDLGDVYRPCRTCRPEEAGPVASRPARRLDRASPEDVRAAIREGRLIYGMTLPEARAAMHGQSETVERDRARRIYTWTREVQTEPDGFGRVLTVEIIRQITTAVIEDGVVVDIDWQSETRLKHYRRQFGYQNVFPPGVPVR